MNILEAMSDRDEELLDSLLDKASISELNGGNDRKVPLMLAIQINDIKTFKKLIDAGADPNVKDVNYNNMTPLQIAAKEGALEFCEILLSMGADINYQCATGTSALHFAARAGYIELVKKLLELGADPNIHFVTPLMSARDSSIDVVRALLEAGADPLKETPRGETAIDWAVSDGQHVIANLMREYAGIPPVALDMKPKAFFKALGNKTLDITLNEPATEDEILRVEKEIGVKFSKALKAFYLLHNGQTSGDFFESYSLLSLDQSLDARKLMLGMEPEFKNVKVEADTGIRKVWWFGKWFPICDNGSGDYICVDLSPTKDGKKGQIIDVNHESNTRKLLSLTMESWLGDINSKIDKENE